MAEALPAILSPIVKPRGMPFVPKPKKALLLAGKL